MPRVSIVVPIYRVEKYLRQCVDSILRQTLEDIEVILVDDGSPDGCPAIVDEYAASDPRVVAIHQANGGYGKAVNTGIARASAPYIGIIESDDWIEPTMYEKLLARAEETDADVVKCGHYVYNSTLLPEKQNTPWVFKKINIHHAPEGCFQPLEWPTIFMFHTGPWSWLYRAEFIRKHPFSEASGASYQDIPFTFGMLADLPRISVLKELLVHYRSEPNSGASSSVCDTKLMRMADMSMQAMQILQQHKLLDLVKEEFFFQLYNTHISNIKRIEPIYRQDYFNKVHNIFKWLQNDSSFQAKYFHAKHQCALRTLIGGGKVDDLFRRWKIALNNDHILIRLAGREFSIKLNRKKHEHTL